MIITISASAVAKVIAAVALASVSSLFFLWPINDRPTSKTQVVLWIVFNVVVCSLLFGNLTFVLEN